MAITLSNGLPTAGDPVLNPVDPLAFETVQMPAEIPQAPPAVLTQPAYVPTRPEIIRQEEQTKWANTQTDKLDVPALDFDNFYPHEDPYVRNRLLASSVVQVALRGDPGEGIHYEIKRDRVADLLFQGRGKGSDEAFIAEYKTAAKGRKDERDLLTEMGKLAGTSALMKEVDQYGGDPLPVGKVMEELRKKPGYKKEKEADYYAALVQARTEKLETIQPFRHQIFQTMALFRKDESMDYVYTAYRQLPPEERPKFKAALKMAVEAMPADQQSGFWNKLFTTTGRAVGNALHETNAGLASETMKSGTIGVEDFFGSTTDILNKRERERNDWEEFRAKEDFFSDIKNLKESIYDPVKTFSKEGSWGAVAENIIYGTPGALATTTLAAIPYVGQVGFYHSTKESAYQDFRRKFEETMPYEMARDKADALSMPAAAIQMPMEMFQVFGLVKKLPITESLMTAAADRIKSTAARYVARTAMGTVEEGIPEIAQNYVPDLVQAIGHAMDGEAPPDMRIPGVELTGEKGVFNGFWKDSATTAGTMISLAMVGSFRGMREDLRVKRFQGASDTKLMALGGTPEAITELRQELIKGPTSGASGIDTFMAKADPTSESAREAVSLLEAEMNAQEASAKELQSAGILPRAVQNKEGGWTLYDTETGEQIATAPTWDAAAGIASQHAGFTAERDADRIAYIASMYQAAQNSGEWSAAANRSTETNLDLGTALDAQDAAKQSDSTRRRVKAQERLDGGDGAVADLIFGESSTDTANGLLHTVNRVLQGGSVLTVFHEEAHGFRKTAHAKGLLTMADDIAILRAVDTVLGEKTTREGTAQLRLLPENFDTLSSEDQSVAIDEGISRLMEAEVIRTRKGDGMRPLPPGLITKNLAAISRLAGDRTAGKFRSFVNAFRQFFGLAIDRATHIKRGLADGTIDQAHYDSYLKKLLGIDEQLAFEQQARDAESSLTEGIEMEQSTAEDEMPSFLREKSFSLGNTDIFNHEFITRPIHENTFVPTEFNGRDRETLEGSAGGFGGRKLTGCDSENLGAFTRLFSAVTNLSVRFFRVEGNAEPQTGGFVNPAKPDTIYLNADTPAPIGSILAHEWLHSLEKDSAKSPFISEFTNTIEPLFIEEATAAAIEKIGETYSPEQIKAELLGNVFADALTPNSLWGSENLFTDWPAVQAAAKSLWEKTNPIAPSALVDASDSDLSSFSLGPAAIADALRGDVLSRITAPSQRIELMTRVSRNLEDLRLQYRRLALLSGTKRLRKSLMKEAAMREATRAQELENEAWARHYALFEDDDLVKIKSQPLHALLASPDSHLHGRLMSRSKAIEKHPDMFQLHRPGDYDGSEGISRSVFGGNIMPDQAAQEAFEAGIIKEPTTDALWDKLRQEANAVTSFKEQRKKATADIKASRQQAKQETNDWLESQVESQEANFSPKQEIVRALSMLDAVLRVLPAEIRGKIGGYTQLARISSDELKLEFLKEKLAAVDTEVEKWQRIQYDKEMQGLLKRARPQKMEAGEKPRGVAGQDVHDLFRIAEEFMAKSPIEAEAEALKFEKLSESEDITAEQEAFYHQAANLIPLVANWHHASAAARESAVAEATRIFETGYRQHMAELSAKRERRGKWRDSMKAATGKAGVREERIQRARKDAKKISRNLQSVLSLASFEQIVNHAFGENTPEAKMLIEWERRASNAKEDSLQSKFDAVDDLFSSLTGGKYKGQLLRAKLATPGAITIMTAMGEQSFSEMDALSATLMWDQDDGRRHMQGHFNDEGKAVGEWQWTQKDIDAIEDKLSKEAKAVRLHLQESYGAEWERLNPIFRQLYGVSLPRHKNYAPVTVKPSQASAGQIQEPVGGMGLSGTSLTPGSLRNRMQTGVAEPEFKDALHVYFAHIRQMEHWMAYAPLTTEAMALINSRSIGNSVEAASGKETLNVLRGWLDYFAQGGNRDAIAHLQITQGLNRKINRIAAAALVGRSSVLVIQSLQLGAALAEMPTGSYAKRFAKLFNPLDGFSMWRTAGKSEFIQRRKQQMPPLVREALDGLMASKPNRLKFWTAKLGELIGGADALFTAGTFAIIHDYQMTQAASLGFTGTEAEAYALNAAERSTERVAQPTRAGARSLYEVSTTTPAYRLLWAFASEGRQKLALAGYALAHKPVNEKLRAVAVTWLVGGAGAALIRAIMRDLRDDEDDELFDGRNWDPVRLGLASLTGPLQGLPILGDVAEGAIWKATGEYLPEGNMFSGIERGIDAVGKVPKWFEGEREWEDVISDIDTIMGGLVPFSDSVSAASSTLHTVTDAAKILDNFLGS